MSNNVAQLEGRGAARVPLSILIPVKNERVNVARCVAPLLDWADEIVIVDSGSTDGTPAVAESLGVTVLQFKYDGNWPKKRQWALDTHAWRNPWILMLDADEILSEQIKTEIARAIQNVRMNGYWLCFRTVFLGRELKYGDSDWWKLSLIRRGHGRFERRFDDRDNSLLDMEVHEHVIVDGAVGRIAGAVRHENYNSLYRYIEKHNGYSNWEAQVLSSPPPADEMKATLFGNQAQRRRWLKRHITPFPGSPLLRFLYCYFVRLGFLDGRAGFAFSMFKGIQMFHVKCKIREMPIQRQRQADYECLARDLDLRVAEREHSLQATPPEENARFRTLGSNSAASSSIGNAC